MPLRALFYRRPSEPQTFEVEFDQASFAVRVRRHRQARRYTLRIQAATREVILTMPPRGSLREAKEFAQKHGGWIAARMHRLPQAVPFADGTIVPVRGVEHRIAHRSGVRGTVWTETPSHGMALLCVAGDAPHIERRVGEGVDIFFDALLGIFDPIATVAAAALNQLAAGDADGYKKTIAPTIALSREIFRSPTRHYKAGVIFVAWLNGHQSHFVAAAGLQSARSVAHYSTVFELADRCGALTDPELAVARMRAFLQVHAGVS